MHQLVNCEVPGDGGQQGLDCGLVAIDVKKATNNLRSTDGVHPLNIDLDEVGQPILVEIEHKIMHEVESIANDDQWELVGQLGLLKEILDLLWVVKVTFTTDSLDLSNLASTASGLNVLEMHLGVLTEIDDRSEIVIKTWGDAQCLPQHDIKRVITLKALVRLEKFDQLDGTKNIGILGGNLNNNLQVLPDIDSEHFLQRCHRLFCRQPAEVVY